MKKILCSGLLLSALLSGSAFASTTPNEILGNGFDSTTSYNPFTGESGTLRKGTVAAALVSVARLNHLLQDDSDMQIAQITDIKQTLQPLIPALKNVGMFDLFSPEEWLQSEQLGRTYIAVLFLAAYPEGITPAIKKQFNSILMNSPSALLKAEVRRLAI